MNVEISRSDLRKLVAQCKGRKERRRRRQKVEALAVGVEDAISRLLEACWGSGLRVSIVVDPESPSLFFRDVSYTISEYDEDQKCNRIVYEKRMS